MTESDSFWRDRATLVTGATGLVGSWLVRRLVDLGADVVSLVRDWAPTSEFVRGGAVERVRVVRGDVCDRDLLERVLGEREIEVVVHLAAQTIVGVANRNPVSTFETNVAGTWALLEACRRSPRVRSIVLASSDKAYGAQPVLPYAEDMPLDAIHPYDVSKACADLIGRSYALSFGVPVVTTRCGNFFGGGDLNWSRVVPGTIRSVLRGERPLIRSDGTFVRDYFYVEDGVDAYLQLAQRQLQEPEAYAGKAFNFSTERPLSVVEIVRMVLAHMGSELEPKILGEASNEIREQYLSAALARETLGWTPAYGLDEGLQRTIAWYCEHLGQGPAKQAQ